MLLIRNNYKVKRTILGNMEHLTDSATDMDLSLDIMGDVQWCTEYQVQLLHTCICDVILHGTRQLPPKRDEDA